MVLSERLCTTTTTTSDQQREQVAGGAQRTSATCLCRRRTTAGHRRCLRCRFVRLFSPANGKKREASDSPVLNPYGHK